MASTTSAALRPAVPFFDGGPMLKTLQTELLGDIAEIIESGRFTNGPQVAELEAAFAAYCGTRCCVGLASGLDALRLGLLAAELEPGDEVVVPAMTFIATFEAVTQAGGVPVVADVDGRDLNLDPEAAAAVVTPRCRFLLPVHLYGQMADMSALAGVAERHDVAILEDACQAHGAERDSLRAGAGGLAAAFSFYPAKNLGALGDAGALVTGDDALAERVRALREHGQTQKYHHVYDGYTARLDTIQAAALLRKLPLLDGWNDDRRRVAAQYGDGLSGIGDLELPPVPAGSRPVWHLYPVRTADPGALADFLDRRGIGTGRHYPEPPHLSAAYERLGHRAGAFPVAERLARESLSLPMFPGMSEQQVEAVVSALRDFFEGG